MGKERPCLRLLSQRACFQVASYSAVPVYWNTIEAGHFTTMPPSPPSPQVLCPRQRQRQPRRVHQGQHEPQPAPRAGTLLWLPLCFLPGPHRHRDPAPGHPERAGPGRPGGQPPAALLLLLCTGARVHVARARASAHVSKAQLARRPAGANTGTGVGAGPAELACTLSGCGLGLGARMGTPAQKLTRPARRCSTP